MRALLSIYSVWVQEAVSRILIHFFSAGSGFFFFKLLRSWYGWAKKGRYFSLHFLNGKNIKKTSIFKHIIQVFKHHNKVGSFTQFFFFKSFFFFKIIYTLLEKWFLKNQIQECQENADKNVKLFKVKIFFFSKIMYTMIGNVLKQANSNISDKRANILNATDSDSDHIKKKPDPH